MQILRSLENCKLQEAGPWRDRVWKGGHPEELNEEE
jgi:hypothetical protein